MTSSSTTAAKDLTEENRKFFNEKAAAYENYSGHQKTLQVIGDEIMKRKEWSGIAWDEGSTRMLDYACGTGLISRILAPYTKQIIGMDLSEGMVEQFNQKVDNQGIPRDEMRAIVANLCTDEVDPSLSDPEYHDFDVAISTLAFHHFSNVPLAINRIVKRLKPKTGVLLIIDFRTHESGDHISHHQHHHHDPQDDTTRFFSGHHTVIHSGFSDEEIKGWYGEAGLVDIEIVDVLAGKMSLFGEKSEAGEVRKVERSVFMAKGRRT